MGSHTILFPVILINQSHTLSLILMITSSLACCYSSLLRTAGMAQILPLPRSRVPIVKFHHAGLGISCDVCVNKRCVGGGE